MQSEPIALSYLIGCAGKAVGAAIDPVGMPEQYLDEAARLVLINAFVGGMHR